MRWMNKKEGWMKSLLLLLLEVGLKLRRYSTSHTRTKTDGLVDCRVWRAGPKCTEKKDQGSHVMRNTIILAFRGNFWRQWLGSIGDKCEEDFK